jgi:hypothetical protein
MVAMGIEDNWRAKKKAIDTTLQPPGPEAKKTRRSGFFWRSG